MRVRVGDDAAAAVSRAGERLIGAVIARLRVGVEEPALDLAAVDGSAACRLAANSWRYRSAAELAVGAAAPLASRDGGAGDDDAGPRVGGAAVDCAVESARGRVAAVEGEGEALRCVAEGDTAPFAGAALVATVARRALSIDRVVDWALVDLGDGAFDGGAFGGVAALGVALGAKLVVGGAVGTPGPESAAVVGSIAGGNIGGAIVSRSVVEDLNAWCSRGGWVATSVVGVSGDMLALMAAVIGGALVGSRGKAGGTA